MICSPVKYGHTHRILHVIRKVLLIKMFGKFKMNNQLKMKEVEKH